MDVNDAGKRNANRIRSSGEVRPDSIRPASTGVDVACGEPGGHPRLSRIGTGRHFALDEHGKI
jgi:hypothetical protein